MKDLNRRVTEAIFAAERADREAARLWDEVAAAERAIAESAEGFSEVERGVHYRWTYEVQFPVICGEKMRRKPGPFPGRGVS